jgi:hypothetical protein
MSSRPRPVLLGYIRADVLGRTIQIRRVKAELATFADREEFSLGAVYVEKGTAAGVFDSLVAKLTRDESTWGVVVPDLRHLTVVEHLVLSRHTDLQPPVVVASHCPGQVS